MRVKVKFKIRDKDQGQTLSNSYFIDTTWYSGRPSIRTYGVWRFQIFVILDTISMKAVSIVITATALVPI